MDSGSESLPGSRCVGPLSVWWGLYANISPGTNIDTDIDPKVEKYSVLEANMTSDYVRECLAGNMTRN